MYVIVVRMLSQIAHFFCGHQISPVCMDMLYSGRLPPSSESKLQLLYKRSVRSCSDPFKRAVYCLLARCEVADNHPEVCVKTEDYMWLKVCHTYMVLCRIIPMD